MVCTNLHRKCTNRRNSAKLAECSGLFRRLTSSIRLAYLASYDQTDLCHMFDSCTPFYATYTLGAQPKEYFEACDAAKTVYLCLHRRTYIWRNTDCAGLAIQSLWAEDWRNPPKCQLAKAIRLRHDLWPPAFICVYGVGFKLSIAKPHC